MVTIIINFSGLSRGSGVGLLSFARKSESCIDMICQMCTCRGIAGSVSFVVNKRPNLPFQNRGRLRVAEWVLSIRRRVDGPSDVLEALVIPD